MHALLLTLRCLLSFYYPLSLLIPHYEVLTIHSAQLNPHYFTHLILQYSLLPIFHYTSFIIPHYSLLTFLCHTLTTGYFSQLTLVSHFYFPLLILYCSLVNCHRYWSLITSSCSLLSLRDVQIKHGTALKKKKITWKKLILSCFHCFRGRFLKVHAKTDRSELENQNR